jgi:hypothetical protein
MPMSALGARLLLAGLIQRPDHQLAPAARTPRGPGQAGDSEPRTAPIAAEVSRRRD